MANKLGFYLHSFEIGPHKGDLFRAIQEVRPPVMLVHAWDQVDQLRRLSPDSLIIGRMTYYGPNRQPVNELANAWLDSDNPEAWGREFAEHILRDNFGMATRREDGRLLIDAWMSLNECVPGPASNQYQENPEEIEQRLRAYDAFQAGFRDKLMEQGVEAVAFNFGAGNFASADHYEPFFPRTLASYNFLGFHEYGWPALSTEVDPTAASSAGSYRGIVQELSRRTGRPYEAILTEAGLALMFKYPNSMDKGWLCMPPPELNAKAVTQDEYWQSLTWLNDTLLPDDFARGACLFEVGHTGDWETFRHFGQDNAGQEIAIIDRIAHLAATGPAGVPLAMAAQAVPGAVTLRGRILDERGAPINGATVRLVGGDDTLGADRQAVVDNRGAVTWTRRLSGFGGSLWNCWQKFVAPTVAGITWAEFRREVTLKNPALRVSAGVLLADQTYYLPENRVFSDMRAAAPVIAWDRKVTGFDGDLWDCWQQYGQGKVAGLSLAQFRKGMLAENPSLASDKGQLAAYKIYRLPRNAGAEAYVRLAYTVSGGQFVFAGLRPGAYRLEISADGYKRLVHPIVVSGDESIDLLLDKVVLAGMPWDLSFDLGAASASPFVRTLGRHFVLGGSTFRFVGVNLRGLAHYGTSTLPATSLSQQGDQLRAARSIGARVVRIFLPDRNTSVEEIIARLKGLVTLMDNEFRELYLIVALTNLYADVPFHVPGDEGFYQNNILHPDWFAQGGSDNYRRFVERVVTEFRNVPRIMAYNVGNELKAEGKPEVLISFMHDMAARIREWDGGQHLVTTGMISTRHAWMQFREDLRTRLYDTPLLDFITNHAYHGDDDPATTREHENDAPSREDDSDLAEKLNKPLLIEEAGFVGTDDRTHWFDRELNLLLGSGRAAGYMPWGFMHGDDNGDGDTALGLDHQWHGADWGPVCGLLQNWSAQLQAASVTVQPSGAGFSPGQTAFTTTQVNLRPSAGLGGAPDQIRLLPPRIPVTIQGPAQERDNLTWWPVTVKLEGGQEASGWIAQVAPDGTTLISVA